jgi:DNA-binding NtrC family response regulator
VDPNGMSNILVVDDEINVLAAFQEMLTSEGHRVLTADRAEQALEQIRTAPPDVVVLDVCMPGLNGLDALRAIRQLNVKLPVIVMTGQGSPQTAIEATKRGAFDYLMKPFDPLDMLNTIGRALEAARLMKRQVTMAPDKPLPTDDAIIGQSAGMQQLYKLIGRVAPTDATVLIRGESGTGKELVARAVYQHSNRADAPLLVLNCTSMAETLVESELFGHERGAFTGATGRRIGKFEQADGGTLFLDEIGDIAPSTQAKILRVLQEREFQRVGGNETLQTNVRLLAATNRNLEQMIAEGTFREDLYHRLNVVTLPIPPLRERLDDIPLMVDYFLARIACELKIDKPLMADDALELLCRHPWPGNVRELEHCLHRTVILTQGHPVQPSNLRLEEPVGAAPPERDEPADSRLLALVRHYLDTYRGEHPHANLLEAVDRLLIEEAMQRTDGNQSQAAKLLGLPRPTLHAKLQKLGLRLER